MTTPIEQLAMRLQERFPHAKVELDAPSSPDGIWFLDLDADLHSVDVEWRSEHAFGVSAGDEAYGAGPHELHLGLERALERVVQLVLGRGRTRPPAEVRLGELRRTRGVTQVELAERLHIKQAAVSRLENRDDVRLSSLRAAVAALGGELQLRVKFPEGVSVQLTPPGAVEPERDR